MSNLIVEIYLASIVSIVGIGAWCLYCSSKTLKQRLKLIDEDWNLYKNKGVTYYDHYRALLFFRNPMKLYHD